MLLGDPMKAKRDLGWAPTVAFEELVTMMVDADLRLLTTNPARSISEKQVDVVNTIGHHSTTEE